MSGLKVWEGSSLPAGRCLGAETAGVLGVVEGGCGGLSCFTAAAQRDPLQKPGVGGGAMSTTTRHRGTATLARMRRTASPPVRALQHEFASLEKTRGNAQHLKCILKFTIFFGIECKWGEKGWWAQSASDDQAVVKNSHQSHENANNVKHVFVGGEIMTSYWRHKTYNQ